MRHFLITALLVSASVEAQTLTVGHPADDATPTSGESSLKQLQPDYRNAVGLSLYWENDGASIKPFDNSDRWYTSGAGIALQWQSPGTTQVLSGIPSFGGEFDPGRPGVSYAGGAIFSLNMYTPKSIRDPNIRPDDRPYAGWTYLGLIAQRADRAREVPVFEHIELDLGVIGPSSRAGDLQKWVHKTFDEIYPRGWRYQVRDEVGIDLKYQRRWRHDIREPNGPGGLHVQLIPDAGVILGTIHTNASAGVTLRLGWNLPDDFGVGSIRYADDFTRSLSPEAGANDSFSGYFFVRPGVQLVAHDATFGKSLFRDDNPVEAELHPVVGEITGGVVIRFLRHCRFSWTVTYLTPQFHGQGGPHSYSAVNLSLVHTW